MKGFVPTPRSLVDQMVGRLFRGMIPSTESLLLDPGCGDGVFLSGVIRWCTEHRCDLPRMVGVESEPGRAGVARRALASFSQVEIRRADFLAGPLEQFDFIIGNPPYVPITGLDEGEKRVYRSNYQVARGRFDLYLLFFEKGLRSLKRGGRLVFVTPEKFLYVDTAKPLRKLLSSYQVEDIRLVDEASFGKLITYPTITTVTNEPPGRPTVFVSRDGGELHGWIHAAAGESWMPLIRGTGRTGGSPVVLEDVCERVSCGVATGADSIFVRKLSALPADLLPFAHPTIAGRELGQTEQVAEPRYAMLIPYTPDGKLMEEASLGALRGYLSAPKVRQLLLSRTCARRKPWYAFHETPPLTEMLKPKILCKDIGPAPRFWLDPTGELVPRHSVYYIVPRNPSLLSPLAAYLNSQKASDWLFANCQRAANSFVRLQSSVLKRLPLPERFQEALSADRKIHQRVLFTEPPQGEPIGAH